MINSPSAEGAAARRSPKRTVSVLALALALLASTSDPGAADELADTRAKTRVPPFLPLRLQAFPLQEVRLLEGPFKHAMELDQAYLLSLPADRLLHNFRINAGLRSSAQPLGGWEEPKCELRGHFVGHYLSACALM